METTSKIIKSARTGEEFTEIKHSSGLTILLCPMEGYTSAYAMFATKYGSVDTSFKAGGGDFLRVPEGIAHFLEHKLFEGEDGDAFEKYAKTGASANAYTSFDMTAYLFSCTAKFSESLEILLDFVTHPYFTEQTVQKEQGIIGQEIKMYEDSPDWRVFFNMLQGLYHNHPLRVDIAGTVESIAEIDAKLLYDCYNTFYNLGNMALSIAGNFSVDEVLRLADKILTPVGEIKIERESVPEPDSVFADKIEKILPVAVPLFCIGYKARPETEELAPRLRLLDELLVNLIAGESTPLYRRLYDDGLINTEFGGEAMSNRDYSIAMFSGESREPEKVRDEINAEIRRIRSEGIDPAAFARYKKTLYGGYIGSLGKVESVATMMLSSYFNGTDPYQTLEYIASITLEDVQKRLENSFDPERCSISIVKAG